MSVKLSIIVPVYNVENYIVRCLESLVHQNFDNYEIIIVVDGSTDNSIEYVKEYKDKYPDLINYYETENRGLSAARNFGLKKAKGDFVGFVDSDDYIDEKMYRNMYEYAITNNCEIVCCGYSKIYKETEKKIELEIQKDDKKEDIILKARPYAWNKIYKKNIFNEYKIEFPEGYIFEDICTIYPLMMKSKNIGYINECYYNYICYREDSIMLQKNRNDIKILDIMQILNDYCKREGLIEKYYKLICEINVRHIFYRLSEMTKFCNGIKYNFEFINSSFNFLDGNFKNWKKDSIYAQKMKYLKRFKIAWKMDVLLMGVKKWMKK